VAEPFADPSTLPRASDDLTHMSEAVAEARAAAAHDDVPIGAVIVREGRVLARAGNRREVDRDPTAHAEIIALRGAASALGRWRLIDCALYVSVEPCAMCAGAAVLARIPLVVFAAPDEKAGAVISVAQLFEERKLNHHPKWRTGVMRAESEAVLRDFFATHRGTPAS
jgi:tRNA(adenine34) deaminase